MDKKIILLLAVVILFSSTSFAYAGDEDDINEDPVDEVFGVLKKFYTNADDLQMSITKYKSNNYYLDVKKYGLMHPIKRLTSNVNAINNLLFGLNKNISKFTISILLLAYKVDLFAILGDQIDLIIGALRVPIFDKTFLTVVAIMGLYSIIAAVFADRKSTILNNIIKAIVILTIAFIFMSNPSKCLSKMNDFSIEVSDELFKASYGRYKKINDSEDALTSAGSMLWDVMAHKPWQILEIGNTKNNDLTKNILEKDPFDDDRVDIIDELSEDNSLLRLTGIFPRFGILFFITLFNIILAVVVSIVSGLSIAAQMMVVILSYIAPLVFLVSLIPRFNNILGQWGLKLMGYSFVKIAISMFLSLLLVVDAAVYSNVDESGIIITLMLMAIVTLTIYFSRKKIVSFIKAIPKGERLVRREIKTPPKAREMVMDARSTVSRYKVAKSKVGKGAKGTIKFGQKTANKVKTATGSIYAKRKQEKYREMANQYMERKYQEGKTKSEIKAKRLGKDKVEYSDFVTGADTRIKLGEDKFTESQINHVIKIIRKIEIEGEDPNKFINGEIEKAKTTEPIEKNIGIKDYKNLTDKDILNRMGKLENGIQKKRQILNENTNISDEEKNNEMFEIYKLWQQKFEHQNILRDRNIENNKKKYSGFNEYEELGKVRQEINKTMQDTAEIFNNDEFKGDRMKAFDEKLDIQVNLKNREDELKGVLDKKVELAEVREKMTGQEKNILNKFGHDKIKNNDMSVHEREDFKAEILKLRTLYEEENAKVVELKDTGIDIDDPNSRMREMLRDKKGNETENLLKLWAEMGVIDNEKEKANYKRMKGEKENQFKDSQSTSHKNTNSANSTNSTNRTSNTTKPISKPTDKVKTVEKIVEKPLNVEQKLDIEKLTQRDEEIIQELNKRTSEQGGNKTHGTKIDGEHIEMLGEEISKNIDIQSNKDVERDTTQNINQNINQNISVHNATQLDNEFGKNFGSKNNQIFFENLIKKYSVDSVRQEMEDMKLQNNIRNPKGLLITRLKNNHDKEESKHE